MKLTFLLLLFSKFTAGHTVFHINQHTDEDFSFESAETPPVPPVYCRDESGSPVDWFIAYKLAKIENAIDSNVHHGLGYAYLLPTSPSWTMSAFPINSSNSIVGRTLVQTQDPHTAAHLMYVAYNDQPPVGDSVASGGHQKGILSGTVRSGFFLQHSVPHFPGMNPITYEYPATGVHNGQIFFCMNLGADQLDTSVASILKTTRPHVFRASFPLEVTETYTNLKSVLEKVEKDSKRQPPVVNGVYNLTVGNLNVLALAKSPTVPTEIYSEWIAPTIKSNLDVQTWLNGPHPMPSNCSVPQFAVYNILQKTIDTNMFATHVDHSKWAISSSSSATSSDDNVNGWICISDLNRMEHQRLRGGAAYCFQHLTVVKSFKNSIGALQPCPATNSSTRA